MLQNLVLIHIHTIHLNINIKQGLLFQPKLTLLSVEA